MCAEVVIATNLFPEINMDRCGVAIRHPTQLREILMKLETYQYGLQPSYDKSSVHFFPSVLLYEFESEAHVFSKTLIKSFGHELTSHSMH